MGSDVAQAAGEGSPLRVQLNGQPHQTEATTLAGLIAQLGQSPEALVVEHNRAVVPQQRWAQTALADGDELELLRFVGGG